MRRSLHTALLTLSSARPHRAGRAGRGSRRRRGPVGRDRRQGHHQRGLLPDRVLPAVHLHDEHDPGRPGEAEGPPQGGREGPPGPRRRARRLVADDRQLRAPRRRGAAHDRPPRAPQRGRRRDGRGAAGGLRGVLRRRRRARAGAHGRRRAGVLRRRRPEGDRDARSRRARRPARLHPPGLPQADDRRRSRGWCLAGGFELALWCDLRVATEDARFGFAERRWGVPLIDGGTQRLPRIVGEGRALDLVLSGRTIEAAEAHAIGLVTEVVPRGRARGRARSRWPRGWPPSRRRRCSPTAARCSRARADARRRPGARGAARPRGARHRRRGRRRASPAAPAARAPEQASRRTRNFPVAPGYRAGG